MIAKKVYENIDFQRGKDPKAILKIGMYPKYLEDFVSELDHIQGRDGFPWSAYEDYVYEEIENNTELENTLISYMNQGLSPFDAAQKMKKSFDKGIKF